jgi:hypothetical protein
VLAIAALVPVLAISGYAAAGERSEAATVAPSTARFRDHAVSQSEGYTIHVAELSGATCIANGADGAMGDHLRQGRRWVHRKREDAMYEANRVASVRSQPER